MHAYLQWVVTGVTRGAISVRVMRAVVTPAVVQLTVALAFVRTKKEDKKWEHGAQELGNLKSPIRITDHCGEK